LNKDRTTMYLLLERNWLVKSFIKT